MSLATSDIGAYASTRRTAAVVGMRADRVQPPPYEPAGGDESVSSWDGSNGYARAARSHVAVPAVAAAAMGALMAVQERVGQIVDHAAGDHVAQVLAALLERLARKSRTSDAVPEVPRTSRSI